ncbi:ATP-binding protein [Leifsonia sp. Leaf264]|uniref:ATP-binding protein n=1 Tax=Leifsonia sp. Leaf264 TaxID=1736314 RepID=UPI0006FC386A|nr:ATP-binding protein [Leifsonia sp. Leaf264]KQO98553.1 hypothetical protein ASF30_10855 [Leifsonia sp. Leaf264]
MDLINPYTPGAGTRPGDLPGRFEQTAIAMSIADQVDGGREVNPMIFTGYRGVGKTSLLFEVRDILRARGWMAGYFEVRRNTDTGDAIRTIVTDSTNQLPNSGLRAALPKALAKIGGMRLTAGPAGVSFSVASGKPITDPYNDLVLFLRSLGKTARSHSVGVALIVDELQEFLVRDLALLIQALGAVRDEPIVLIGAGLPYLPADMAKANTYAERFRYESIGFLARADSIEAVTAPAFGQGVIWEPAAAELIADKSEGYPFMVQLFASEAWKVADRSPITLADAEAGVAAGRRQLDNGLYQIRYSRLSPREREYVDTMVHQMGAGNRAFSGNVADSLGKSTQALAPARDRIIKKGIIASPAAGILEFSVPGFADYVRRVNGWDAVG